MAYALDGIVRDVDGVPVSDALVYIFSPDGVLADLYDDLGDPIDNPRGTNQVGVWSAFSKVEGFHTVKVNYGGRERKVYEQLVGEDPITRAYDAAGAAEAFTGPTFASVSDGLANTSSGDFFAVVNGGIVTVYLNNAGSAVYQRDAVTQAALASTEAARGAGQVGFAQEADYDPNTVGKNLKDLNLRTPYLLTAFDGSLAYIEANANVRSPALAPGIGHSFVARSSTSGAGTFAASIGAAFVAINDMDNAGAWAQYATAVQTEDRISPLHLYEGDIAHLGDTVPMTPQNINPDGLSNGYRIMSGGELSFEPHNIECKTASTALLIGSNDPTFRANWDKGILFHEGFCESAAIALGTSDKLVWYRNGNPETALDGTVFNQYILSDGDCYHTNTTRLTAGGLTPSIGQQLGRHDFFDHGAGTPADANASMRVISLGGGSAGWQALAANATNTLIGVGINTQGNNSFAPTAHNAINNGTATSAWANIYANNGTIQPSDLRLKMDLGPLPEPVIAAFRELSGKITHGQYLDAREIKGDAARKHIWIGAQTIVETFAAHGVDAMEYGFVGHDPWMEVVEEPYEVEEPVLEPVDVAAEDIQVIDGKATVSPAPITEMRPKFETQLLWNPDGSPAMEKVPLKPLMKVVDGEIIYVEREPLVRQRARKVPVMQTVTKTREIEVPKLDEDGNPMMKLSVRNDQLLFGLSAAMAAS